jgi:low temperature requirement protein LtrA
MFAGMVGAISIPEAFGARAWLLVAGYVSIQVVRNLFVVLVTPREDPLYDRSSASSAGRAP